MPLIVYHIFFLLHNNEDQVLSGKQAFNINNQAYIDNNKRYYLVTEHPKIKLFITQGGLQSTDEAIAGGVPLIGIPMIWDQAFNVDKYVQLKIGIQLDINSLTETNLKSAIDEVIGDKR